MANSTYRNKNTMYLEIVSCCIFCGTPVPNSCATCNRSC